MMTTAHVSPSSLLRPISGASNRLMLNLSRKWSASSSRGLSEGGGGWLHPQQSDGITSKKRTCSWQVNWNHHWCYLFSNVPRLTGDILFGTHPKGGRGAQRFSAPSHSDSRSVLTPKQWDSLETCSGICHNPAPQRRKRKCTQLLVYTHPDLSRRSSPTSASATAQEIVCPPQPPQPPSKKKEGPLKIRFFFLC